MAIAKGRTECERERDSVSQGFMDLFDILKKSKSESESHIKAILYDYISDYSLEREVQQSMMRPYIDCLSDIENIHDNIRSTILIGLYAYWETSLKRIYQYYVPQDKTNNKISPKCKSAQKRYLNTYDY